LAATQSPASFQQPGAGTPVNGAIHPATPKEALVGGINDRLNFELSNVSLNDLDLLLLHTISSLACNKRIQLHSNNRSLKQRGIKSAGQKSLPVTKLSRISNCPGIASAQNSSNLTFCMLR
jgi:hypothetical protein